MAGIESVIGNVYIIIDRLAPTISIVLIVLGGIIYGLSHTQPAEIRGKWQTTAAGLFIGGVIIATIAGAATVIRDTSKTLLI